VVRFIDCAEYSSVTFVVTRPFVSDQPFAEPAPSRCAETNVIKWHGRSRDDLEPRHLRRNKANWRDWPRCTRNEMETDSVWLGCWSVWLQVLNDPV